MTPPTGTLIREFRGSTAFTAYLWLLGGGLAIVASIVIFKFWVDNGSAGDAIYLLLIGGVLFFIGLITFLSGATRLFAAFTLEVYTDGFRLVQRDGTSIHAYLWSEVQPARLLSPEEASGWYGNITRSIIDTISARKIENWTLQIETVDGKRFRFTKNFYRDYKGLLESVGKYIKLPGTESL